MDHDTTQSTSKNIFATKKDIPVKMSNDLYLQKSRAIHIILSGAHCFLVSLLLRSVGCTVF